MNSRSGIAGVVILYNPLQDVYNNIESYIGQVDRIYAIDNSVNHNLQLRQRLELLENVVYVNNQGNKGIAHALNVGAEMASKRGYRFILTMDQDTHLPSDFVAGLLDGTRAFPIGNTGIIAPRYSRNVSTPGRYEDVLYTMTSGNILNLEAFRKVGPFREELFIDHVDHEYCLRLHAHGYSVIQDNFSAIPHIPGNIRSTGVLGKTFSFSSHAPVRLYYFVRNGLYVSKLHGRKFPQFRKDFLKLVLKEIAKIPLEKEKILRIRMLLKAFRDYRTGKMGPID